VTTYFDTSAIVPLYLPEVCSGRAHREVERVRQIPFTQLHALELTSALQLNCGRGLISTTELRAVQLQIEDDIEAHRLQTTPVDLNEVFTAATELARLHAAPLLCRSLDVLHVAAALHLHGRELVSAYDRQLALAKAVGLDAVDLKKRASASRRRR